MEFQLTRNQNQIFKEIKFNHHNYLVLGEPGVGKSVLIRALTDDPDAEKEFTLAAPTGLAALNINGRTLHSIFKLPTSEGIIPPTYNAYLQDGPAYNFIKYRIKHLIIDEISMVRADAFDYIDRLMRHVKRIDAPFGGVQMICIGDFYQLPPVVAGKEESRQMMEAGYDTPFIFSSRVFKNNFKTLTLNEVLRQKGDPAFIDILAAARTGSLHPKHTKVLNTRVSKPDDIRIKLTCTNKEADIVNYQELRKLDTKEVLFQASKFGEWPALPAEAELRLKIGAQIMVKMNGADKKPTNGKSGGMQDSKVVNGTLGVITQINDKPGYGDTEGMEVESFSEKFVPHVMIKLDNGMEVPIYVKRWERKIKELVGSTWEERVVASYEQMPLALAWAISIHKSQGQSFDKAHIDLKKVFAPGQAYVALSRVRSLAGISFESGITTSMFRSNADVDAFFEYTVDVAPFNEAI
jgi:ATP-dependent exoDNAse (exonuclease V) alpha subunit